MDAASLFVLIRSAVLGGACWANAMWIEEPPTCCNDSTSRCCNADSSCSACSEPCAACTESACPQEQTAEVAPPDGSLLKLAHWMGQWISGKPRIQATFAVHATVHGVAPELNLEAVVPCGHKICAGGKCYEVEEGEVVGKSCDQVGEGATGTDAEEEPIVEAPVAPPLPPSYQFTSNSYVPGENARTGFDEAMDTLMTSTMQVPVGTLLSLVASESDASARLEVTKELMAERLANSEKMLSVLEQNAQLQQHIAMLEARQYADALAKLSHPLAGADSHWVSHSTRGCESGECVSEPCCSGSSATAAESPASELKSIHEDLANIRRQIALLKRQLPIPFAPSYVGVETLDGTGTRSWRTASGVPYVPVSPVEGTEAGKNAPMPEGASTSIK